MKLFFLLLIIGLSSGLAVAAPPDPMQYGRAFLAEGNNAAAVKSYAEALRLNPFDPVALNNLGVAKAAAGDYQAAIDFLVQANHRAPNRRDIKENLENLQAWVKTYSGVASVPGASLPVFTPELPPLWSAQPRGAANPDSVRP